MTTLLNRSLLLTWLGHNRKFIVDLPDYKLTNIHQALFLPEQVFSIWSPRLAFPALSELLLYMIFWVPGQFSAFFASWTWFMIVTVPLPISIFFPPISFIPLWSAAILLYSNIYYVLIHVPINVFINWGKLKITFLTYKSNYEFSSSTWKFH